MCHFYTLLFKVVTKKCLLETFVAFDLYEHKETPDRRGRRAIRSGTAGWAGLAFSFQKKETNWDEITDRK